MKAGKTLTLTDAPAPGIWFYRVIATLADKPTGGPASAVVRPALPGELRYALALVDGTGTTAVGSGLDAMGKKLRLDATLASGAGLGRRTCQWQGARSGRQGIAC